MRTECARGHAFDEANTLRYMENGRQVRRCRACKRMAMNGATEGLQSLRNTFLPIEPLVAIAPKAEHDGFGNFIDGAHTRLSPNLERAYWRARKMGRITYGMADEISIAFGYHPALVWGDQWWEDAS